MKWSERYANEPDDYSVMFDKVGPGEDEREGYTRKYLEHRDSGNLNDPEHHRKLATFCHRVADNLNSIAKRRNNKSFYRAAREFRNKAQQHDEFYKSSLIPSNSLPDDTMECTNCGRLERKEFMSSNNNEDWQCAPGEGCNS